MKAWISAFRLRTLPLALSSIALGSFLAADKGMFDGSICFLSCLTTVLLQILSNLANDYGDTENGADHANRVGPVRMVQQGAITKQSMKRAIYLFAVLSLMSGLGLLWIVFGNVLSSTFITFFVLGILSIIAAVKYTAGKNPYGYMGLGDVSVFFFFGIVGVMGSYYLYTHTIELPVLLLAVSCGLFSTGVLNINNIRDIESDKVAGKNSIPVRIGEKNAKVYHTFLIVGGMVFSAVYFAIHIAFPSSLFVVAGWPILILNVMHVWKRKGIYLDPLLKQLALGTLAFVFVCGGILLAV